VVGPKVLSAHRDMSPVVCTRPRPFATPHPTETSEIGRRVAGCVRTALSEPAWCTRAEPDVVITDAHGARHRAKLACRAGDAILWAPENSCG
jgi:hypothetical protein